MRDTTRLCAHCGVEFVPIGKPGYSQGGTYCADCRASYAQARRDGIVDKWHESRAIVCDSSGCDAPVAKGHAKFCKSHACSAGYQRTPRVYYTCALPACHNICISGHAQHKYCSNACVQIGKRLRRNQRTSQHPHWRMSRSPLGPSLESWPMFGPIKAPNLSADRPCADCGEAMESPHAARKRCSKCARRHNISKSMGLYEAAYLTGRVKQAMHWRYELVNYLRERDGDKCALCSKRMRFDVTTGTRGKSDMGATVDHILPRSHDGGNDLANLQLAHWACNRAKSNRGEAEQLRLVG